MKNFVFLIFFVLTTFENISGQLTIYEQQDNPNIWGGECLTGQMQSPINLIEKNTVFKNRNGISYNGYRRIIGNARIVNNGKSIQAQFQGVDRAPNVTFNSKNFVLQQFHFHWNASEHALNGKLYDGEIHLVHRAADDTFLVLGGLLKKTSTSYNIISNIFVEAAKSLVNYQSEINYNIDGTWRQLLDEINMDKYLYYLGSLTTPNCNEGVTWIVYPELIQVDSAAIEGLKNIRDNNGTRLLFTNRRIHPLNGRKVYKTYKRSFRTNFLG